MELRATTEEDERHATKGEYREIKRILPKAFGKQPSNGYGLVPHYTAMLEEF